jgi:protein-L-isoaspartate(D-aspartate) O-methyltransferase
MFAQTPSYSAQLRFVNMLASYGIKDPVLSAFRNLDRAFFLPKDAQHAAYEDRSLHIGEDQTNSQPSLTALTLQELSLKGDEKVLEIGTGSGFQTALLSFLTKEVISIEIKGSLGSQAKKRLKKLNIQNAKVIVGDGTPGFNNSAPYDVVIVNACFESISPKFIEQLKEKGKLVMPIGSKDLQELVFYKKIDGEMVINQKYSHVKFVPLLGEYGFKN